MKNLQKFIVILIMVQLVQFFPHQDSLGSFCGQELLTEKYKIKEAPTYVVQKEEIYIQENVALVQAIEKVEKSVVGIGTQQRVVKNS